MVHKRKIDGFVAIGSPKFGLYEIIFRDKNGMSILARTRSTKTAKTKLNKFAKQLEEGKLLKEDSSVWNVK